MPKRPRLAEVHCTKIKFDPGDKIIVRTNNLDPLGIGEQKKLRRTIEKWAGCELEILIVQRCLMDIEIVKDRGIRL